MTTKIDLVLLIDNQSIVSNHLLSMMEGDNEQVVLQANDYVEGMQMMENVKPDFVLIDVSLNGELRSDILKEIGREKKDGKIVVITNLTNQKYLSFCEAMGVNYFLDTIDLGIMPGVIYKDQMN